MASKSVAAKTPPTKAKVLRPNGSATPKDPDAPEGFDAVGAGI